MKKTAAEVRMEKLRGAGAKTKAEVRLEKLRGVNPKKGD